MKKRSINPLTNLYDRNCIADKRLRRDLNLFTSAAAIGTVFFAIATGTPFSGLAVALGADDLFYALLFALPIATSFLQFIASWLLERTRRRKTIFLIGGLIQRVLWVPVALVPLFVPMGEPQLRLWSVIILITLASAGASFMNVTFFSWFGDVVPIGIRGRYIGLRASISTVLGLSAALVASWVLDQIPGLTGYEIVFGVGSLFGIADIVTFIWVRDPPMQAEEHQKFSSLLSGVLKDRPYLMYLLFWTAWVFCWNLSGPFFAKYCLTNLKLSITVTTLTGQVAYGLVAFPFMAWWGHKLDHHSHRWVLIRGGVLGSFIPLFWLFAHPGSFWPNLLFNLANGVFVCGMDITSMQMLVTVTPQKNRATYIATYMVVTSVVGASLGYLAGGGLLELMKGISFSLLGVQIDQYKLLFVGAGALRLAAVLCIVPLISNIRQGAGDDTITENKERDDGCARQESA